MTLNDLERRNSPYFAFSNGIRQIFRPIISQWLKTYNVRKILSPSSSLLLLATTITHPAARSLCDSWASCYFFRNVGRNKKLSDIISAAHDVKQCRPHWHSSACAVIYGS